MRTLKPEPPVSGLGFRMSGWRRTGCSPGHSLQHGVRGERDRLDALSLLRSNILAEPGQPESAFSELVTHCGRPGAGKSGLTHRLASELQEAATDVVFLPVDLLNVQSLSGLQQELGISRPLHEILRNWPGSGHGVLIVDALDAARKLETQNVLREALDQVLFQAKRWKVIAPVRKYDLRQGTQRRRMFQGSPVASAHADAEFSHVSHISVDRLSDDEITQTVAFSPELHELFTQANGQLRQLLRNIFNLHLLSELVAQGVVTSELAEIRTQSELLEAYWRHRIRHNDGKHDAREAALTAVVKRMITTKSLRIFRADVRESVFPQIRHPTTCRSEAEPR